MGFSTTLLLTTALLHRSYSIKVQNMKEPYVIFYTENVATQSLKSLRSLGIYTFPITKIDTPYRASHEATKFQYTRINLWAMTNYTTLVSLDLDTLVKHDISALFRCGSFCASMRHSDKFNAGVMVLKPNKTVFDDMSKKYSILPSYDGGDQGFMNSYFANTKYASMFNPDDMNWPNESNSIHTLSMAYNYDVGAYYLQSRLLIEPKIIHYTMGPTKPWIWWTYPMFDLNWEWYRLRVEVERLDGDSSEGLRVFFTESLIALFLLLLYKILANYVKGPSRWRAKDSFIAYFLLQLCALAFSFLTVPSQKCLLTSWTIFIANQRMRLRFSLTGYSVFLSTVVSTLTISGEVADHSVVKDIANIVSAFDLLESPNCTAAYWNKTLIVDKACTNLNNSISDGENKIALFSVRPPITQCSGQLIDIYWCNVSLSFDIKCIEKEASSWEPDAHNLATIEEDREYKRHHHHSGHHHHHHNGHHHHHHHHGGHFHLHGHHHGHFHPHRHVHVGFGYFPVWTHLFYGHPYYWGSATALVTICLVILCIICIRTACLSPHLDECHSCECVEPAPLVVMQGPPPQQIPSAEQQLHP